MNHGGAQRLLVQRLSIADNTTNRTLLINSLPLENELEPELPSSGELVHLAWRTPVDFVMRVRNISKRWHADVVVVHSPFDAVWLKIARGLRLLPIPMIEVVHNTSYKRKLVEHAARLTNKFADGAFAVSRGAASGSVMRGFKTVKLVHGGIDIDSMMEIAGTNRDWFSRTRAFLLNGTKDGVLLVYCGRLVAEKRLDDLINALAIVDDPRLVLAVVGDGPMRAHYEDVANDVLGANKVSFLGQQPNGWRYISIADIFCLTSEYEGLPVALMEAVLLGKPVLGTDITGVSDILIHGENSLLGPPRDVNTLAANLSSLLHASRLANASAVVRPTDSYWSSQNSSKRFYAAVSDVVRGSR